MVQDPQKGQSTAVDAKDQSAVRALLARCRTEIMARYKAAGVGVGRRGDRYVIVVYLKDESERPRVAQRVEGVDLSFEVTGPFKTFPKPPA